MLPGKQEITKSCFSYKNIANIPSVSIFLKLRMQITASPHVLTDLLIC